MYDSFSRLFSPSLRFRSVWMNFYVTFAPLGIESENRVHVLWSLQFIFDVCCYCQEYNLDKKALSLMSLLLSSRQDVILLKNRTATTTLMIRDLPRFLSVLILWCLFYGRFCHRLLIFSFVYGKWGTLWWNQKDLKICKANDVMTSSTIPTWFCTYIELTFLNEKL